MSGSRRLAALALAGVVLAGSGRVAGAQASGSIRGTVTEFPTLRPLAGARIVAVGLPLQAVSGREGEYELKEVPPGVVRLRIFLAGHVTGRATVRVEPRTVTYLDFELRTGLPGDTVPDDTLLAQSRRGVQVGSSSAVCRALADMCSASAGSPARR